MSAFDVLILIMTLSFGIFSHLKLQKKMKQEINREKSVKREPLTKWSNIN